VGNRYLTGDYSHLGKSGGEASMRRSNQKEGNCYTRGEGLESKKEKEELSSTKQRKGEIFTREKIGRKKRQTSATAVEWKKTRLN